MQNKIDFNDVEFIIYCYIDSQEREENLRTILTCTLDSYETSVTVVEMKQNDLKLKNIVDSFNEVKLLQLPKDIEINRGVAINYAVRHSSKEIIVIHDSDVLFKTWRMKEAIDTIRSERYMFAFPYNGRFYDIPHNLWEKAIKTKNVDHVDSYDNFKLLHANSVGGGYVFNKQTFLAGGGINENLKTWGPGDREVVERFAILGYPYYRASGDPCLHLSHPRNTGGWYNPKKEAECYQEYYNIRYLGQGELKRLISNWPWRQGDFPERTREFQKDSNIQCSLELSAKELSLDREKLNFRSQLNKPTALLYAYFDEFLQNRMKHLQSGFALYGCGKHTEWLLKVMEKHKLYPHFLIDDIPHKNLFGIKTIATNEITKFEITTIIISSDTWHYDMHINLKKQYSDLTIFNPYEYLPQAPFQKF